MRKVLDSLIEAGDRVPLRYLALANGGLGLFITVAQAFGAMVSLALEGTELRRNAELMRTSAVAVLPFAAILVISAVIAFRREHLVRKVLALQTVLLSLGAVATVAWTFHLLTDGFAKYGGASWSPGVLTMTCAYPVYLARRAFFATPAVSGVRRYAHLLAIIMVLPLDVAFGVKVMAYMQSVVRSGPG